VLAFLTIALVSRGQTVSGGPLVSAYAPSNNVFSSATVAPNDLVTFSNKVGAVFGTNGGGVFNMQAGITTGTTVFRGTNNNGGMNKQIQFTSSRSMQAASYSGGTFGPSSSTSLTTSSADVPDYKLTFGVVSNLTAGNIIVGENVVQLGAVVISRTSAQYPVDVRVTAVYTDGTSNSATATIGNLRGTNVFYGFTAPANQAIASVQFESFSPGTLTPVNTRIGLDDLGLITGITGVLPAPTITGVTPANYSIAAASNGMSFQVTSVVNVDPTNISLVLNGTNNVSNQLVITGNNTNCIVGFSNLLADQEYFAVISVTNGAGSASLTQVFYTATSPFVLYDSHGFTNDALYPVGPLQNVTDGRATWIPNASEPAQIVSIAPPQEKVLERQCTGASRADFLGFQPVSSGIITVEFDTFISTTLARTIDVCIQPPSAGTAMASLLAWGEVSGKLAYFDNVNWIPIADLTNDWHHIKIIHYLSGLAGGKSDIIMNGVPIAQKVAWRNTATGTTFNQFRIQAQNTAALFEYGRIDNLVITAAPEDPNVFPPPQIVNLNMATNPIVHPNTNVQFAVTSGVPIASSNITVLLDSNNISGSLVITGPNTNLSVSYGPSTAGNHQLEIHATSVTGSSALLQQYIAADESWLYHPSDGWFGPWQWTASFPQLSSTDPLDGVGPYLRLDFTTSTARNFMRQYQSGTVDITKAHYIRWKFRVPEANFDAAFTTFNDRVHFFARNAPRLTAGTDAANTWAISATGNEQTLGSGVSTNQFFYIFDNVDNTSAYNANNLVNSGIRMYAFNTYTFEVLVMPETKTYLTKLVNNTSNVTFTSSAPHKFRDLVGTGHTLLHFGAMTAAAATPRPFDLDSVFITQATLPVTLVNPVRNGNLFSFSFQSQAGVNHTALYNNNISVNSWTPLTTVPGDGSIKSITHTNPPADALFYRVSSSPQ
jgi:hypothetical protein